MKYTNNSTRELWIPKLDGTTTNVSLDPGDSVDGSSRYGEYNLLSLERDYEPVEMESFTVADPVVVTLPYVLIVNGYTAVAGDATELPTVASAGTAYTLLGTISWNDGASDFETEFSVIGDGVHASGSTFDFDNSDAAAATTKPINAGSSINVTEKTLSIKFDSGAPTAVNSVALTYDFTSEPGATNLTKTLGITANRSYFDQMRRSLGLQARDAISVTPHDTDFIRVDSEGIPEEFTLYIGTGGDVVATMASGASVTFANVTDGTFLPVRVTRIVTATTASDIVALHE